MNNTIIGKSGKLGQNLETYKADQLQDVSRTGRKMKRGKEEERKVVAVLTNVDFITDYCCISHLDH